MQRPWIRIAFSPILSNLRVLGRSIEYRQIKSKSDRLTLTQLSAPFVADRRNVVVVMTVRNEMALMPACLLHYRLLGINEFHIVDNGSTDGTREYLSSQNDVTLWSTEQSYRDAYYGVIWVNNIIHNIANGRWALFVDADEFLYYDGMEDNDIHRFAEKLDARGQSYLYAPLIDIYGFDEKVMSDECTQSQLLRMMGTGFHDIEGYKMGRALANGYCHLLGGPRGRISEHTNSQPPLLTKYPLIKCSGSRYFTASSHEFMPQVSEIHDVSGWLAHLKLGSSIAARHADPAIECEHYGQGIERRFLAGEKASKAILADPTAIHFDGLKSLKEIEIQVGLKR
jgi:hypothetical protein